MRPPPTPHRLNRYALRAGLWLAWLVGALPGARAALSADPALQAAIRARLDRMERTLVGIIVWRAILAHGRLRLRPHVLHRHDVRSGSRPRRRRVRVHRVLTGRVFADRRLRSADLGARIAALRALHARIDRLAARILRRLARGLLPLLTLVMTRPPPRLFRAAALRPTPVCADTS